MTTHKHQDHDSTQLRDAWSNFLQYVAWDHFITLTFSREPSDAAARAALQAWLRKVNNVAQQRVDWFWVLEIGQSGHRHLHVLLANTSHMQASELQKHWRLGRIDVQPFRSDSGGERYVVKTLGEREVDYDLSPALERRIDGRAAQLAAGPGTTPK